MVLNPEYIEWDDANREHATRHGITEEEINQVLRGSPVIRRNRKGRSGDYYAFGSTHGGREVVVVVAWDSARRIIRPITAWEQR